MRCPTASLGCLLAFLKSRKMIRVGVALAVALLLLQVGVIALGGPSDSFGFFGSAAGKSALSRGLGDLYTISDILKTILSLPRNLTDSFHLLDSLVGKADFSRGIGATYTYKDQVNILLSVLTLSCAAQLSVGHSCSLLGAHGNQTFLIDTCVLSGGACTLSGNDTISAIGIGSGDVFNITDGPGSDTYSINAGHGNATFYVDACDGAPPTNFSLSFQGGLCTSLLLPPTDENTYSLLGGGNAVSPDAFVILDGPGDNIYSLTGGTGPDNFTIYGGSGNDTYAIVGGAGSSFKTVAGNGTETYAVICGSDSLLNITNGSGQETFGIIAGSGSSVTITGTSEQNVYNIAF